MCTPEPDGGVRVEGVIRDLGTPDAMSDELRAQIAQREATQQVLADLSVTDYLTGARNRRYFMKTLRAELERADRIDPPAVLLIDIDRFKSVNDTYGHQAGDVVLVAVADRLAGSIREGDTVARYGGEEFAVLLPEMPDLETLEERAETIRRSIALTPVELPGGAELTVTASCGAAVWSEGETDEALLDAADRGLYAAKRGGRDRDAAGVVADGRGDRRRGARGVPAGPRPRARGHRRARRRPSSTARRSPTWPAASPPSSDCPRPWPSGAAWAAGCTTSASSRFPTACCATAAAPTEARAILHTHVELGADIVSRLWALGGAHAAVRHHHERYDGTGYPDALAGDQIPIDARIVAAADAWSAITTGRPYQQALEPAAALEQLRASAGRSLDPAVVAALAAVVTAAPDLTSGPPGRPTPAERRSEAA